ncbi:hypothetical protein [Nonomuraea deserti]|nr:hypothetical protein [Nonomuraea deserti]
MALLVFMMIASKGAAGVTGAGLATLLDEAEPQETGAGREMTTV